MADLTGIVTMGRRSVEGFGSHSPKDKIIDWTGRDEEEVKFLAQEPGGKWSLSEPERG